MINLRYMCTVRQKRLSSTHTHVRACLITLLGTVWPCQSRMLGEFGRLVLCSESWELVMLVRKSGIGLLGWANVLSMDFLV